jgi:hypothetical protein
MRPRVALLLLAAACALPPPVAPGAGRYDFFEPASQDDWNAKILVWQAASRIDAAKPPDAFPPPGFLGESWREAEGDLRREIAERVVAWMQTESGLYYRPDANGDRWPTLPEVLSAEGDDCDGIELLGFTLLRRLGFGPGEIYRTILLHRESGQHHMVTLWFAQGPAAEPLVLDPTGELARRLVPLGLLHGWAPIALFDETAQYRARPAVASGREPRR